jgi:hypothetical protein
MIVWTPEIEDRLRAMWADGVLCSVIAARLGVSSNAIAGKARRLGLPMRQPGHPRNPERPPAYSAQTTEHFDPKRADRLLRRFSWESQA